MLAGHLRDCGCIAQSRDVSLQAPRVGPGEGGRVAEMKDVAREILTDSLDSTKGNERMKLDVRLDRDVLVEASLTYMYAYQGN